MHPLVWVLLGLGAYSILSGDEEKEEKRKASSPPPAPAPAPERDAEAFSVMDELRLDLLTEQFENGPDEVFFLEEAKPYGVALADVMTSVPEDKEKQLFTALVQATQSEKGIQFPSRVERDWLSPAMLDFVALEGWLLTYVMMGHKLGLFQNRLKLQGFSAYELQQNMDTVKTVGGAAVSTGMAIKGLASAFAAGSGPVGAVVGVAAAVMGLINSIVSSVKSHEKLGSAREQLNATIRRQNELLIDFVGPPPLLYDWARLHYKAFYDSVMEWGKLEDKILLPPDPDLGVYNWMIGFNPLKPSIPETPPLNKKYLEVLQSWSFNFENLPSWYQEGYNRKFLLPLLFLHHDTYTYGQSYNYESAYEKGKVWQYFDQGPPWDDDFFNSHPAIGSSRSVMDMRSAYKILKNDYYRILVRGKKNILGISFDPFAKDLDRLAPWKPAIADPLTLQRLQVATKRRKMSLDEMGTPPPNWLLRAVVENPQGRR